MKKRAKPAQPVGDNALQPKDQSQSNQATITEFEREGMGVAAKE